MKRRTIMVVALVTFSPWVIAQAEEVVEDENVEERVVHTEGPDDRHVDRFGDPRVIIIDSSGLNELIHEVMEAVHEALEGGRFALDRALRSSTDALRFLRMAKAESGESRAVDETQSTGDHPDIDIYNLAGSVRVIGTDKNEVRVEGTIGEDVTELEFDASRSDVDIRVKFPRGRNRKVKSDLIIHVPKGSSVDVRTVSATIAIDGIEGESIDLESVSGSISVKDSSGEIDASSTSGRIAIEGDFEEADLETVSGSIRTSGKFGSVEVGTISGPISLEGVQDSIEAESVSGSITIKGGTLEELEVDTIAGTVRFDGMPAEDADFKIETLSGSVRLTFDAEVSGEFDLRTFSGGINTDFGPSPSSRGRSGRGKTLRFTHGDGDATIEVETFSGSITLRIR
ncbi:MAG: DUF4097 family beta strand repeat protein [Candidatus Hydrogenedentes bacterium]|nr:DUF4097 family beta strand repeat protein [Candidatus Hydrogenedentota bacterium]